MVSKYQTLESLNLFLVAFVYLRYLFAEWPGLLKVTLILTLPKLESHMYGVASQSYLLHHMFWSKFFEY